MEGSLLHKLGEDITLQHVVVQHNGLEGPVFRRRSMAALEKEKPFRSIDQTAICVPFNPNASGSFPSNNQIRAPSVRTRLFERRSEVLFQSRLILLT